MVSPHLVLGQPSQAKWQPISPASSKSFLMIGAIPIGISAGQADGAVASQSCTNNSWILKKFFDHPEKFHVLQKFSFTIQKVFYMTPWGHKLSGCGEMESWDHTCEHMDIWRDGTCTRWRLPTSEFPFLA